MQPKGLLSSKPLQLLEPLEPLEPLDDPHWWENSAARNLNLS